MRKIWAGSMKNIENCQVLKSGGKTLCGASILCAIFWELRQRQLGERWRWRRHTRALFRYLFYSMRMLMLKVACGLSWNIKREQRPLVRIRASFSQTSPKWCEGFKGEQGWAGFPLACWAGVVPTLTCWVDRRKVGGNGRSSGRALAKGDASCDAQVLEGKGGQLRNRTKFNSCAI